MLPGSNSFKDFYRGKKVLVTGHTGFKGSWLTLWLKELGAEVAGLSNGIPTDPSLFETLGLENKIEHYWGDIREFETVRHVFSKAAPEIVFHLAAQSLVRTAYKDPRQTFGTNVMGTLHVLEVARKLPSLKNLVVITSDKCYENVEQDAGYLETDRLGGHDPYSASKACAEILYSSFYRSYLGPEKRIRSATARAGNVIGGGDWSKDRVVVDCFRALLSNEPIVLRSPNATRPWQHVLEPLSGYLHLGARLSADPSLDGNSFNFGPMVQSPVTVQRLIEGLVSQWKTRGKKEQPIQVTPDAGPHEAKLLSLDCSKAKARLGWRPTLTVDETIAMTADWYAEEKDLLAFTKKQIQHYQEKAQKLTSPWATGEDV